MHEEVQFFFVLINTHESVCLPWPRSSEFPFRFCWVLSLHELESDEWYLLGVLLTLTESWEVPFPFWSLHGLWLCEVNVFAWSELYVASLTSLEDWKRECFCMGGRSAQPRVFEGFVPFVFVLTGLVWVCIESELRLILHIVCFNHELIWRSTHLRTMFWFGDESGPWVSRVF